MNNHADTLNYAMRLIAGVLGYGILAYIALSFIVGFIQGVIS